MRRSAAVVAVVRSWLATATSALVRPFVTAVGFVARHAVIAVRTLPASPSRADSTVRRGDRTRTCNLRFWRPLLYQLSHTPTLAPTGMPRRRTASGGHGMPTAGESLDPTATSVRVRPRFQPRPSAPTARREPADAPAGLVHRAGPLRPPCYERTVARACASTFSPSQVTVRSIWAIPSVGHRTDTRR